MPLTDPDRLFPSDPAARAVARRLHDGIAGLPIVSPHGHCDPRWFAENTRFPNPAELFVVPDHYVFRMLVSQGVPHADLGVPRVDGGPVEQDPRAIWRRFAGAISTMIQTAHRSRSADHASNMFRGLEGAAFGETARHSSDDAQAGMPKNSPRARCSTRFGTRFCRDPTRSARSTTSRGSGDLANRAGAGG